MEKEKPVISSITFTSGKEGEPDLVVFFDASTGEVEFRSLGDVILDADDLTTLVKMILRYNPAMARQVLDHLGVRDD